MCIIGIWWRLHRERPIFDILSIICTRLTSFPTIFVWFGGNAFAQDFNDQHYLQQMLTQDATDLFAHRFRVSYHLLRTGRVTWRCFGVWLRLLSSSSATMTRNTAGTFSYQLDAGRLLCRRWRVTELVRWCLQAKITLILDKHASMCHRRFDAQLWDLTCIWRLWSCTQLMHWSVDAVSRDVSDWKGWELGRCNCTSIWYLPSPALSLTWKAAVVLARWGNVQGFRRRGRVTRPGAGALI